MKTRLVLAALACLTAAPAWARQPPAPAPSGLVIHLFGTGSATPAAAPASAPAATAPAAPAPALGGVLQQMFVTGDPSVPSTAKLSHGKTTP